MNPLNRNVFLWILPLFLFAATSVQAEDEPTAQQSSQMAAIESIFKRYGVKSVIIEYTLSGVQTGTETVYIDGWGKREARYTQADINMMGQIIKANRLTLLEGEWIYAIDLDKKSGTKIKNPMFEMAAANHPPGGDLTQMGIDMIKQMGGEKIGSEEIAGKTCEVWEVKSMATKSWLWNMVPLKTEAIMGDMQMSSTATKVEEGAPVPEDKFHIPSDIQMISGPEFAQMMQPAPEESLKKGDDSAA